MEEKVSKWRSAPSELGLLAILHDVLYGPGGGFVRLFQVLEALLRSLETGFRLELLDLLIGLLLPLLLKLLLPHLQIHFHASQHRPTLGVRRDAPRVVVQGRLEVQLAQLLGQFAVLLLLNGRLLRALGAMQPLHEPVPLLVLHYLRWLDDFSHLILRGPDLIRRRPVRQLDARVIVALVVLIVLIVLVLSLRCSSLGGW